MSWNSSFFFPSSNCFATLDYYYYLAEVLGVSFPFLIFKCSLPLHSFTFVFLQLWIGVPIICYSTKLINSCQAETNVDTEKKPIFWDYHQRISRPYQTCEKQHQKKMTNLLKYLKIRNRAPSVLIP